MLTGSMVLKRAMVVAALALSTCALGGDVHAAAPDTGRSCTTEQFSWTGLATFDDTTATFDTGVVVPVVIGTDLVVVGVSADGLTSTGQARAMSVTVGGVPAVAGGTVLGGAVAVLGDGSPAEVRNATVVIDRCAMLQSAAPVGGAGTALPHTGTTIELGGSLIGTLAVAAGAAMMVAGRRRTLR
jgi:hypothetical protein